jgi:hypothetical protein
VPESQPQNPQALLPTLQPCQINRLLCDSNDDGLWHLFCCHNHMERFWSVFFLAQSIPAGTQTSKLRCSQPGRHRRPECRLRNFRAQRSRNCDDDPGIALFFVSWLVGNLFLLNVVVAVLLDEFIANVDREKHAAGAFHFLLAFYQGICLF